MAYDALLSNTKCQTTIMRIRISCTT